MSEDPKDHLLQLAHTNYLGMPDSARLRLGDIKPWRAPKDVDQLVQLDVHRGLLITKTMHRGTGKVQKVIVDLQKLVDAVLKDRDPEGFLEIAGEPQVQSKHLDRIAEFLPKSDDGWELYSHGEYEKNPVFEALNAKVSPPLVKLYSRIVTARNPSSMATVHHVQEAWRVIYEALDEYSERGALDTEPRAVASHIVARVLKEACNETGATFPYSDVDDAAWEIRWY